MFRIVAASAALVCAEAVRAHPEIEDALLRLNTEIAARPTDAELFVERGELYARHDDLVAAEANYLRAAELAPDHPRLPLARGALELASGRAMQARTLLNAAVARDPRDVEALVLRARANAALNDRSAAVADFNAALELIATPSPELLLERAALLPPADAIRSLDAGMARIGTAVSLQLRAIALEESLGRVDAAVTRIDRVAEQSERKESWLKRRGDVLARAGRIREARAAYTEALAKISDLPAWLRESPEVTRLAAELARLSNS